MWDPPAEVERYVWAGAEARTMAGLRRHLTGAGVDSSLLSLAGYWRRIGEDAGPSTRRRRRGSE